MNIAIGLISREAGGAEFQSLLLADSLRARGHRVWFFCTHPAESDAMLRQVAPIPTRILRRFPILGPLQHVLQIAELRRWLWIDRIDAVIGMLGMPHALLTAAALGTRVRVYGRRSAVWAECSGYGTYDLYVPRLQRWVKRWGWRTTALVCNAEAVIRSAHELEGWPEDKLHLIPNGWPEYPPLDCAGTTPWYIARPREEKRVDLATQAFARAGVPLALCFEPPVWSEVGILVHASRAEGMSNSIGMAMAHGIPVVAFDLPGNRELLYRDACVRRWDYAQLAEGTRQLVKDRGERQRWGRHLWDRVRTHYSLKAMVDGWEEVLTR